MTDTTNEPTTEVTTAPVVPVAGSPEEYDSMSLRDMQTMLTSMEFVGSDLFTSKKQAYAVITSLRARQAKDEAAMAEALENVGVQTIVKGDKGEELIVNPTAPKPGAHVEDKTDASRWEGKKERMKKYLWSQPLTNFMIPLGFGEKRGSYESVIMNGYRLNIMKGVMVQIPVPIANHLAESYQLSAEAGKEFAIDRDELVKEKLD